jgi:hypothetical protein
MYKPYDAVPLLKRDGTVLGELSPDVVAGQLISNVIGSNPYVFSFQKTPERVPFIPDGEVFDTNPHLLLHALIQPDLALQALHSNLAEQEVDEDAPDRRSLLATLGPYNSVRNRATWLLALDRARTLYVMGRGSGMEFPYITLAHQTTSLPPRVAVPKRADVMNQLHVRGCLHDIMMAAFTPDSLDYGENEETTVAFPWFDGHTLRTEAFPPGRMIWGPELRHWTDPRGVEERRGESSTVSRFDISRVMDEYPIAVRDKGETKHRLIAPFAMAGLAGRSLQPWDRSDGHLSDILGMKDYVPMTRRCLSALIYQLTVGDLVGSESLELWKPFNDDERRFLSNPEKAQLNRERVAQVHVVFGLQTAAGIIALFRMFLENPAVTPILSRHMSSEELDRYQRLVDELLAKMPVHPLIHHFVRPFGERSRETPWGALPTTLLPASFAEWLPAGEATPERADDQFRGRDLPAELATVDWPEKFRPWFTMIAYLHRLYHPVHSTHAERTLSHVHGLVASKAGGWSTLGPTASPPAYDIWNEEIIETDGMNMSSGVEEPQALASSLIVNVADGFARGEELKTLDGRTMQKWFLMPTNQSETSGFELRGYFDPKDWGGVTAKTRLIAMEESLVTVPLTPGSVAELAGIPDSQLLQVVRNTPDLWRHIFVEGDDNNLLPARDPETGQPYQYIYKSERRSLAMGREAHVKQGSLFVPFWYRVDANNIAEVVLRRRQAWTALEIPAPTADTITMYRAWQATLGIAALMEYTRD